MHICLCLEVSEPDTSYWIGLHACILDSTRRPFPALPDYNFIALTF